jgi:cytochrome c oxidase subunit III
MPDSATLRPEIQYATLEQQGDTAQLGMWVFLVNETIFFGALIFTYFVYRLAYPDEIAHAAKEAVLWCGSVNLVILLTSSLTMVLAINSAAQGRHRNMIRWLIATAALGVAFLLIKGYEYYLDFESKVVPVVNFETKPGEGRAGQLFWVFYWVATGLHAIHLMIGVGLVLYMLWRIRQRKITSEYYAPLEVVGIYWSFVDTVWLFLYPSIYLVGRS